MVDRFPAGVAWQQLRLTAVAAREHADVLWGPHGTLPWTGRTPSVITIHDLTSITIPRHHLLKTVLSFNTFITRSLERATGSPRFPARQPTNWSAVSEFLPQRSKWCQTE